MENQNYNTVELNNSFGYMALCQYKEYKKTLGRLRLLSLPLCKEAWICSDKADTAIKCIIFVLSLN